MDSELIPFTSPEIYSMLRKYLDHQGIGADDVTAFLNETGIMFVSPSVSPTTAFVLPTSNIKKFQQAALKHGF